jgi:DEAD/DEAH box helicase domain-containing protein
MQETLIPSALAQHIKENVISYLRTTFNIKNTGFAENFEKHIRSENGLFKGPYVDIKLPFKAASSLPTDLLDIKPQFRPFEHQVQAFRRITSKDKDPQNTLVVTGTGSGKTECFLIPALDHCVRNHAKSGIKVIILYPMNALAFDQARRIGEMIYDYPELKNKVTAGILVGEDHDGEEKRVSHKHMTPPFHIIDDRNAIIQNPPDILLTNYKMLDNLLMKPNFKGLWEGAIGDDSSVQYLVLDEMHTYDGAQGADVALLIRRLKAKLAVKKLTCVGTSATLSSDSDGTEVLKTFAHRLFGEDFETESIIRETRKTVDEVFNLPVKYSDFPKDSRELTFEEHKDISKFVSSMSHQWFKKELESKDLGIAILSHKITRTILECLEGKPLPQNDLLEKLKAKGFNISSEVLNSFLALLAHATSEVEFNGKVRTVPLFFCRVQLWIREMRRLLANLNWSAPNFKWYDEIKVKNEGYFLPPIYCEECGEHGYLTVLKDDAFVWDVMTIYEQYAEATKNIRYLFPWRDEFGSAEELLQKKKVKICPECGMFEYEYDVGAIKHELCPSCSHKWEYFKVHDCLSKEKKKDKRQCPSCETTNSLRLLASRATTMASIVNGQIFLSKINPRYSKRLLVFSDSVQDASHRAGYFNARTFRFNFRTAVQSFLEQTKGDIDLLKSIEPFWNYWVAILGERKAAATFTPSDLMMMSEYDLYMEGKDKTFIDILKERLLWEFYMEFSLRSQVGRTLEKTGSSAVYIPVDEIASSLKEIFEKLQEEYLHIRDVKYEGFEKYFLGIMERSLTRGAIAFDFFDKYRQKESAWELDKKYFPWISRLPKGRLDGSEVGALPKFISTNILGNIFDFAGATEQGDSWYSYWYKKNFQKDRALDRSEILEINSEIFNFLATKGILNRVQGKGDFSNYGFNPQKARLTKDITTLVCNHCAHKIVVPHNELKNYKGLGCVITHCKGQYNEELKLNSSFYQDIYKSGDVERIFASEHTGLLGRKRRELIETEFKEGDESKRRPDSINLLSCTPTLEMGIDIGDLSATVVASLPPTASNYQQQIGRAGRKTGSALVVSVAQARPRDLLFYRFPEELITGNIQPPGCFLDAPDILKRQFFAFILDQRYATLFKGVNSPKVDWLIEEARKSNNDGFISRMKKLLGQEGKNLHNSFKEQFTTKDITPETWQEVQSDFLLAGDGESVFLQRLLAAISEYDREKGDLNRSRGDLEVKMKEYQDKVEKGGTLTDEENENLKELKREQASLFGQLDLIGARSGFFEFLTHRGFLPNYAFQEDSIELVGMILDKSKDKAQGKPSVRYKESFDRPAKMGLRELAPFNTFYGGGFKLEINQIDVGGNTKPLIEDWRACCKCGFIQRVVKDEKDLGGCPKCGDPMWKDNGQKTKMLKFQRAIAVADAYNAHISDDAEDRQRQFFKVRPFFDISKTSKREAWAYNKSSDFVFGLEFLDTLILREINFGLEELVRAEKLQIGGEELPGGFHICTSCGRVAKPHAEKGYEIKHTMSCRFAKTTTGPEKKGKLPEEKPILLYRELQSEGIRLLLPVSDYDGDARTASIKAAIMLGFIKKFGGRPMHLEISEQKIIENADEESAKRFLVLFDSVPGGTGFLRELWSKDSFFDVIAMAQKVLVDCSCQKSPDLDGCPRCILAGASQFEYPLISRKEGIKYLEEILKHKDGMEIVHGGLDEVDVSSFLDSELEYKFLNIIRNLKSETYSKLLEHQGIKIDELKCSPNIQDGVVIKLSKEGASVNYKMTFQKTLNEGEKGTRVDFYFEPIGVKANPIALYLDGYKYHAGKVSQDQMEKDFIKREALVNGDGVEKHGVWLLTWGDIDSYIKGHGGVREYLGIKNSHHNFLGANSLAQFFDYLFINAEPKRAVDVKNELLKITLLKEKKLHDPSLIDDLKGVSLSAGLAERVHKLYENTHSDSGLLAWNVLTDTSSAGIFVDQKNKELITAITFESKLADRNDEEGFLTKWSSLLRLFNLFQMLSSRVVCKVWAERNK